MIRSTRMAGLHITKTVTGKLLIQVDIFFGALPMLYRNSAVPCPVQGALQTPRCRVCREPVIRMLAARTCMQCTQDQRYKVNFSKPFSHTELWHQSVILIPELRSGGRRRSRRRAHGWSCTQQGDLKALWLMKAYSYKNIPPTSWHETIFILSLIEFESFFSQLLNLKLCLYTAQSVWRYVKASDLYLLFFQRNYKDVTTLQVLTWQNFPRTATQSNRLSHAWECNSLKLPHMLGWLASPNKPNIAKEHPGDC